MDNEKTVPVSSLKVFDDLGHLVDARWRQCNYDERAFPDLATEALARAMETSRIDPFALAREALLVTTLPKQRDPENRFGQPAFTVFQNDRFNIDVYFWFEGTTSIHQHTFVGAFHVLHGSSIHSEYEFSLALLQETFPCGARRETRGA